MAGARALFPDPAALGAAAERGREQQKTNKAYDSSAHGGDLIAAHALCHGRPVMHGEDAREAIARLEDEIESLMTRRERCRKLSRAAKIAILAGAAWLVCTLIGFVYFWPSLFLAALAAVIAGIVLLGSNATTWEQTDAAIEKASAARADLIGEIELRVVDDGVKQVH